MVFYNVARQLANLKNIVAPRASCYWYNPDVQIVIRGRVVKLLLVGGTFLETCSGVKLSLLLLLYRGMYH